MHIVRTMQSDRVYGAGPGMLNNVIQGSIAATVAATITACGLALAATELYRGSAMNAAALTMGKALVVAVVAAAGVFTAIKES